MIAHLIRSDGQEAHFHLRTITIPPSYLIRNKRLYACQPDYDLSTGNLEIVVRYRETACPCIDIYIEMSEAQIAHAMSPGIEYQDESGAAEEAAEALA